MKKHKKTEKNIIIGAGPGGLIHGLLLKKARPDDEVIIYEAIDKPGGFCTTFEKAVTYKKEKLFYKINIPLITSQFSEGESFDQLLDYLGVENIRWKHVKKIFKYYPLDSDPFIFSTTGPNDVINLCCDIKEKNALTKHFKTQKKLINDLLFNFTMHPNFWQKLKILFTMPGSALMAASDKTYKTYLDQLGIKTPLVREIIDLAEAFMGTDVDKVSAVAEMGMIESFLSSKAVQPCNGDDFITLPENMERRFLQLGGKVIYKTKINEIVFSGNKAIGIKTGSETILADNIILAVEQDAIPPLLQKGKHIKKIEKLLQKANALSLPNSDYYAYYLIDKKAIEERPDLKEIGYHIYKLPDGLIKDNWRLPIWVPDQLINDKYYYLGMVLIEHDQEKIDWWIDLRNTNYAQYKQEKEKLAAEYEKALIQVEPLFQKYPLLKPLLVFSPASYLPYGSKYPISGYAQTPQNIGVNRMHPILLENLTISGSASFSGGVFGAIVGAWVAFYMSFRKKYDIQIGNKKAMFSTDIKNLP